MFGTFAGLASWFSLSLKSAFALAGIGIFLAPLVPMFPRYMVKLIAVVFALLFTLLNILSVKESGRFQVVLVFALLAILLVYVATGIRLVDAQHYSPFAPEGWPAIFTVTGMILVYFLLIVEMGLIPLMLTGEFFTASLLWYFLYSRSRNRRESALLHVLGRITNRELRSQILLAQRVRKASV